MVVRIRSLLRGMRALFGLLARSAFGG